jgi:hypothetical protein
MCAIMRFFFEASSTHARQIPPSYGDALRTRWAHSLRGVDRVPQAHLSLAPIVASHQALRRSAAEIGSIPVVAGDQDSRLPSFKVLGEHNRATQISQSNCSSAGSTFTLNVYTEPSNGGASSEARSRLAKEAMRAPISGGSAYPVPSIQTPSPTVQ